MSNAELLTKLWQDTRVPPPEMVQTIDKGKFKADAVGHADVTEIILSHDPEWELEAAGVDDHGTPVITKDPDGNLVFWAYLTIHGRRRLCVGTCKPGAPDIMKELLGDAIRNGAMRFGVAITLWSKTERNQTSGQTPTVAPAPARAESRSEAAGTGTEPAAPPAEDPLIGRRTRNYDWMRKLDSKTRSDVKEKMLAAKAEDESPLFPADEEGNLNLDFARHTEEQTAWIEGIREPF